MGCAWDGVGLRCGEVGFWQTDGGQKVVAWQCVFQHFLGGCYRDLVEAGNWGGKGVQWAWRYFICESFQVYSQSGSVELGDSRFRQLVGVRERVP